MGSDFANSLVNERLLLLIRQCAPLLPEVFRDLGVVRVRVHLDDLPPLQLGPSHEGIHRPFHVVLFMLPRLQNEINQNNKTEYKLILDFSEAFLMGPIV